MMMNVEESKRLYAVATYRRHITIVYYMIDTHGYTAMGTRG